ncbi:mechanosensitive ion channel family protein [Thermohalobacter berrensis]|uniref:Mechanosensitive ion channel protein n=1 Tax=Thermohalobacter berrensis TaxID=99594 RepID=A0A419T9K2_9FIRM|nr:mechanosensitive ion channel family protein [Thermohalobacter berrensis]RKD34161.1 mechanosensitive ion channel protein [Thermohalobacter berrensis]
MEEIINRLPELSLAYLGISIRRIGIAIGIFFVFLLLRKVVVRYIFKLAAKFTSKTKSEVDDNVLKAFENPTRTFIAIFGLYLSLRYLNLGIIFNNFLSKFFRSSIIVLVAWGLYNLEGTYSIIFERMGEKFNLKTNKIIKPFLSKILRFLTIALAIGIVAQEFDYDVSGFIAGLGIGGLAIAMAAKDSVANIFGGIVIIMDKPFDIGDWISCSKIEGVVEDINFRSTRIRTFSKALITVPNSHLANEPITNHSRRGIRRVDFKLGVTYSTTREKLQKCVEKIEKMLIEHPDVDKEKILVKFDEFNDSSLDILVYYFTKTADWEEYLSIKQDINFKIMDILEDEKVSVAFPSRSIYFENTLKSQDKDE